VSDLPSFYKKLSFTHLRALIESVAQYDASMSGIDVLRLDQIDPIASGNKLFKLEGFLRRYAEGGYRALLSFGGPYSNHLHALSAVCQDCGIPVILMVRGYEHLPLTPTLADCRDFGAQIHFADKKTYARRYDTLWQQALAEQYQALVIPEGGQGADGEIGCARIASLCYGYDEVWMASGSGTTALGIARTLAAAEKPFNGELVAVNAVADQGERRLQWQEQMPANVRWRLLNDAHCGGFARTSAELLALIAHWDACGLPLDPVYTAKVMLALQRDRSAGKRVLMIHSGGLQGRRGVPVLAG